MPSRIELQRAYRRLIAGLAFFELVHVLGLVSMGLWLLPGLSPELSVAQRAGYVRDHVWEWRLGWLPWQLCALSDVWVGWALIGWSGALGGHARGARRWAIAGMLCLLIAIAPEQYAEARLVGDFPALTASPAWGAQLDWYMWLTGTWANSAYTLMTGAWLLAVRSATRAFVQNPSSRTGRSHMAEAALLLAFMAAGVANHFAFGADSGEESAPAFLIATLLNGVAFPGLLLLGIALAMRIGAVQLQATAAGAHSDAAPRWPSSSRAGTLLAHIAGAPGVRDLLRALQSWLPFPALHSDVRDVLYLNWLLPAERLDAALPAPLRAHRFGDDALLSLLAFRHGSFGPALLGPLRKLLPSPIQCNVRAYLAGAPEQVVFLANSIDAPLYFAGSRLLSDGLPVHCAAGARLERDGALLTVAIDPGAGSALQLRASVEEHDERSLLPAFAVLGDFDAAVAAIVPQSAALRVLPTTGQHCRSQIVVDAPLARVRPARVLGAIELGEPLRTLVADAPLFAFTITALRFAVTGEHWTVLDQDPGVQRD